MGEEKKINNTEAGAYTELNDSELEHVNGGYSETPDADENLDENNTSRGIVCLLHDIIVK